MRIIRRGSGSVVTWRRAQMVLLSAQGRDMPAIAKVAFTSQDRVRDVIRNFNADGFGSPYPKYKGGRQPGVADVGRGRGHRVEDAPHAVPHLLRCGASGRPRGGGDGGSAGEVEQVGALGLRAAHGHLEVCGAPVASRRWRRPPPSPRLRVRG